MIPTSLLDSRLRGNDGDYVIPSGARNLPPSRNVRGLGGCLPACRHTSPRIPRSHRSARSRPLTQAKGAYTIPPYANAKGE